MLTDKGVDAGGHYMTGPIYVCGAQHGDVIEVSLAHKSPVPQLRLQSLTASGCTCQDTVGLSDCLL